MLSTLFRKRKITESQLAQSFVNTTIRAIDDSFLDIIDVIKNDSELTSCPSLSEKDIDKFTFIVFLGWDEKNSNLESCRQSLTSILIVQNFRTTFLNISDVDYD